ncbi:MAG: hypothetical protein H7327_11530 [Herminiimonas sp.]|nr:hypothetical protein [Herminiimonas sp.]
MLPVTERLTTIPVYIGIADGFSDDERRRAAIAIAGLQALLPDTELIFAARPADEDAGAPVWFRIVRTVAVSSDVIKPCLEVEFTLLCHDAAVGSLCALLQEVVAPVTAWSYTAALFHGFVTGKTAPGEHQESADGDARIVCVQLAALERFNRKLAGKPADNGFFIARCNTAIQATEACPHPARPVPEAPGMARLHTVGAAADHFAILYQTRWQQLVLATTNQLAGLYPRSPLGRLIGLFGMLLPASLIVCGIGSALGYAIFTEFSLGCQHPDFFLGEMCMSAFWKHWVGPAAFFLLYLLSLAWAWGRYAAAKADRVENQHQDYRLLAECLRVQYVLGVLDQPVCVHEFLPMVEHAEAGWVRLAVLSLEYLRSRQSAASPQPESNLPAAGPIDRILRARQDFVEAQAAYHADKLIVRRERAVAVLNWLASLGMGVFLVILLVLVVQVATEFLTGKHLLSEIAHHVLIVLQIVSLAFWGSMRKVADLFGLEQEIQRGKLVLHALRHVEADASGSQVRLMDALKVFTADQAAWHALQRAKPIEAATGA